MPVLYIYIYTRVYCGNLTCIYVYDARSVDNRKDNDKTRDRERDREREKHTAQRVRCVLLMREMALGLQARVTGDVFLMRLF